MKIVFIGMACSYTDGMTYQDQMMAEQALKDGHEVYYISNAEKFDSNGKKIKVPEQAVILENGLHLVYVEYDRYVLPVMTEKLRGYRKIYAVLKSINPDIIYVHGPNTIAVRQIVKYVNEKGIRRFFVDSHADYHTSGTTVFSRILLHKFIYKKMYKLCLRYTKSILCVSDNCIKFAKEVYGIPETKLEFYPLGGEIYELSEDKKANIRKEYGITPENVVIIQAGKQDKEKKLIQALKVFEQNDNSKLRYCIVGSLSDEIECEVKTIMAKDRRIIYAGWKSAEDLKLLLCSADIYIQPGKVSAIAQNAICCGKPVILNAFDEYKRFVRGNGWLVSNENQILDIFNRLNDEKKLKDMSERSYEIARKTLDYVELIKKIY